MPELRLPHSEGVRKCAETIYRVSMPEWHVSELAKGVSHKPLPSQAQGCATRKAVSKNCTLPKCLWMPRAVRHEPFVPHPKVQAGFSDGLRLRYGMKRGSVFIQTARGVIRVCRHWVCRHWVCRHWVCRHWVCRHRVCRHRVCGATVCVATALEGC